MAFNCVILFICNLFEKEKKKKKKATYAPESLWTTHARFISVPSPHYRRNEEHQSCTGYRRGSRNSSVKYNRLGRQPDTSQIKQEGELSSHDSEPSRFITCIHSISSHLFANISDPSPVPKGGGTAAQSDDDYDALT